MYSRRGRELIKHALISSSLRTEVPGIDSGF
jgi:hypothetical protein